MSFNFIVFVRLFLVLTIFSLVANAQTEKWEIADQDIEALKGKTVIFILPSAEYKYYDDYTHLLPEAWTMTPLKVVKYSDLDIYLNDVEHYAFFQIVGIEKTAKIQKSAIRLEDFYSNTHYYLSLVLPVTEGNKLKYNRRLCRVELDPATLGTSKDTYTTIVFKNFRVPFMVAYLRFVQQNIKNKINPPVYKTYDDEALLSKVKNDTLYVIDSLLYSKNKYNGRAEKNKVSLFEDYQGIYKIVSTEEVINIIQTRDKSQPIYLFEYVLSSTDKYVSIIDVRSGTVIKRSYSPLSYSLKSKDIRNIIK